jgi:16S rRNA processing protein RimM
MSEAPMSELRVRIGQIVGAFGLKGQVKVEALTNFESRFEKGSTVFIDDKPFLIQKFQIHKNRPLITLQGVDHINKAEALQWKFMEAEGEPELEDDEFLIEDLIGLRVVTEEGEELGIVTDIEDYPAHQIVLVGEIMIPLVDEFILEIDLDEEIMRVKLIYGMRPGED